MSLLTKIGRLKQILNVPKSINNQVKCVSYHYPDWKPGPYPKTKEEREAAAKKYGMLPEEYEPYPDDGCGLGDYPNVPIVSEDCKDLNLPYQHTGLYNRNWNDPISFDWLSFTAERFSTNPEKNKVNPYLGFLGTLAVIALWGLFVKVAFHSTYYHLIAPKQYPHKGETHYSFEIVED